jgi:carbon-monoxide dehydrogenase large subunit
MTEKHEVIGTPQTRLDAYEKVTGSARFIADLGAGDAGTGRVLQARVVRSPHGHARLLGIDTSAARAVPGVKAVVTGQDVPRRIGAGITDQWVIARDKVRYWGEPVAVVVANTLEAADQAAGLVQVEYEPLPVVLHPYEAAQPGAPLLHEDLEEYAHDPVVHPVPGTNLCHHYRLNRGEVEAAFANAHLVVENEYWMPWIAHVQMEPHGALAQWDGENFQIWSSSQSPFFIRETIANLYGLSPARVRIVIPYVGGGFGGKSDVTIEPLLAVAAHAVPGLPVQLILTREEMFFGTVVGRGGWGRLKTAVSQEGMLLAVESDLYIGSGGFGDYSIWISQGGGHNATGPYYIPNLRLRSQAVYTNTPPTGAFRGYGHSEVHWMVERQMDVIAGRLGMDPAELRRKNLLRPGKENSLGQVMQPYNGRADLCLESVVQALGEKPAPSNPRRVVGHGLACFMKSPVMRTNAQSGAIVRFNEDGSATIYTGSVEIGQGSNTVLAQIAAEVLHMPFDQVHYSPRVDTDYSPHEWQTVASHTTWAVGNAVRLAAEDALNQIKAAAAQVFNIPADQVEARHGQVYPQAAPECALPYEKFATGYRMPNGVAVNPPVVGRGTFVPKGLTFPDPATGQGNMAASWTFGCQGAEVEVDLDTGQLEVRRVVSAQDPGRVINPVTARGQVEGAVLMAVGATLMEKLQFRPDGSLTNHSFVDYRIATTADTPHIEVIFIETEDATGPFGARGLGEHGIVAVPAAVANAVVDALGLHMVAVDAARPEADGTASGAASGGVWFPELPITPEHVLDAVAAASRQGTIESPMRGGDLEETIPVRKSSSHSET